MNDQSVSIALYIKDRAAQQLTRIMLHSAGANVLLCDDPAGVQKAADRVQAIVLGLTGSLEDTVDAVVMLRKRFMTMPIYVVADLAGQRHRKRIETVGATEVIPNAELQQRAAQLVSQLADSAQIENLASRPLGWAQNAMEQGYDVESMDLETWLAIPGNRRLLGMTEPVAETDVPAETTEHADRQLGTERSNAAPAPPNPLATAATAVNGSSVPQPAGPSLGNAPDPRESLTHSAGDFADFPQLMKCREEHAAQNDAILDAHQQRERRLQAAIKTELYHAMTERIDASERKTLHRIDAGIAEVRRELAAARRINIMMGGLVILALILVVVLGWHTGG